jgi:uncharacterized protein (DUF362 family)
VPDRRAFLRTAATAALAPSLARCAPRTDEELWERGAFRKADLSAVAVLAADRYDLPLADTVMRGLVLCGVQAAGRRVVLKPNLVEFDPRGAINTNPAVIAATIEAFRRMDAREVIVAEGPGHRRDNEYLLTASGLHDAMKDTGARFVDLNGDAVRRMTKLSRYSSLDELWLPATVLDADLFVSMPKLKVHHWAGVTLSMKNLFGIMPGSVYGWPKNVLHWAGIQPSILDINATLSVPRFNILDGIVGMEGDGPISGTAKQSGVLVFGADPVAVDATAARLMHIDPARVAYVREAGRFLGNHEAERIEQRGEDPDRLRQDYALVPAFAHLRPGAEAA